MSSKTMIERDSASGNEKIDDLIQKIQSKINDPNDIVFEWIPYDQFDGIEEISKGDVATSCLHNNSQNNINELLSEIKTYSINNLNNILKLYGILIRKIILWFFIMNILKNVVKNVGNYIQI
ncbi:unnamed protein product [Rhizophagus irregularis]|nr:unnamed protein product [Rhizophagus irregularis]